jgi:16S rRNA (guanine527-N7)-methyltransferase
LNTAPATGRLAALAGRHGLPPGAVTPLLELLGLLAREPIALTTVRDPLAAANVHVADSLVALELEEVRTAHAIADLGAGGGFPGLALAVALPQARVALVESVQKKCAFLRRAADGARLSNVDVVCSRAEEWGDGLGWADLVTARALAPLPVVLEYAAPLLRAGGSVVAWKGALDRAEQADGAAAARQLGLSEPRAIRVHPFEGAGERHLHLSSKVSETPPRFPRRSGRASKRPLGPSTTA